MKKLITLFLLIFALNSLTVSAQVFSPSSASQGKKEALNLTGTCAFRSEYGSASEGQPLCLWTNDICIYVQGSPSQSDLDFIDNFLMQLSFRVPQLPQIYRVYDASSANIVLSYVPLSQMSSAVTDYVEGNWGMFHYWYNGSNEINRAEIGIATDVTDQEARNHLFMEELIGAIGLPNDHDEYEDSIIYQPWTTVQKLSDVDWLMLNMIYNPAVYPGMDWNSFYNAICSEYALY